MEFKTVEKTVCFKKKFFLSEFKTFLNANPLKSEVHEHKIDFSRISLRTPKRSGKKTPKERYLIQGMFHGKIGKVTFTFLPHTLIPKWGLLKSNVSNNLHRGRKPENLERWIVEVVIRKDLPRPFILAVEHFIITYNATRS